MNNFIVGVVELTLNSAVTKRGSMNKVGPTTTLTNATVIYAHSRLMRGEIMETTGEIFKEILNHFCEIVDGQRPVKSIKRSDITEWLEGLTVAPATIRLRLSTVKCFFKWLANEEIIKGDPTLNIKGPKKPRTVPRGLSAKSVSKAFAMAVDNRERLIISLMVQEGLRAMEVANLEMGDIDLSIETIQVHGKGGHQRILPLTGETLPHLANYLAERGLRSGFLIQSYQRSYANDTDGLTRVTIARLASQALHRANIVESGHALRHTMAHEMIHNGANIRDVQNALGHASIMSTQVYLPLTEVTELRAKMGRRKYTYTRSEDVA